jgi:hypothetical protein
MVRRRGTSSGALYGSTRRLITPRIDGAASTATPNVYAASRPGMAASNEAIQPQGRGESAVPAVATLASTSATAVGPRSARARAGIGDLIANNAPPRRSERGDVGPAETRPSRGAKSDLSATGED